MRFPKCAGKMFMLFPTFLFVEFVKIGRRERFSVFKNRSSAPHKKNVFVVCIKTRSSRSSQALEGKGSMVYVLLMQRCQMVNI